MIVVSPFHRLVTAQGLPPLDACALNIGPAGADSIDMVGLLAWFTAEDILGLSDGDPVASWTDSSGNGRHMARAVAAEQPEYVTSIPGGGPIVRFAATSKGLTIAGFTNVRVAYTFHLVIRYTPGTHTFPLALSATSGAGGFSVQPDRTPGILNFGLAGNPLLVDGAAHCGWQCLSWVANEAGRTKIYRNGTLLQDKAFTLTANTDATWTLGSLTGFSTGMVMDLAEVQLYSVAQNAAAVLARSQGLRTKWNLKDSQGV